MNWDIVTQKVAEGVAALAPIAETLAPEAAPAIAIINKVIQGLAAAEPTAIALVKQIQSGVPPTIAQLSEYYSNYKTDDDLLAATLKAQIG